MTEHESALVRDVLARARLAVRDAKRRAHGAEYRQRQRTELWRTRAINEAIRAGRLLDEVTSLRRRNVWLEDELLRVADRRRAPA